MEKLDRVSNAMNKPKFDESKLASAQLKALAIAKSQGVPFSHKLENFRLNLDPVIGDELAEAIEENRLQDRALETQSSI